MSPAKGPKGAPRPAVKKTPLRSNKSTILKSTSLPGNAAKTLREKLLNVKGLTEKLWKNKQKKELIKLTNEQHVLKKDTKEEIGDDSKIEGNKKSDKKITTKKLSEETAIKIPDNISRQAKNNDVIQTDETTLIADDSVQVQPADKNSQINLPKTNHLTKATVNKKKVPVTKKDGPKNPGKRLAAKKNMDGNESLDQKKGPNVDSKIEQVDSKKVVKSKKQEVAASGTNSTKSKKVKQSDDKKDKPEVKRINSTKIIKDGIKKVNKKMTAKKIANQVNEIEIQNKKLTVKKNVAPKKSAMAKGVENINEDSDHMVKSTQSEDDAKISEKDNIKAEVKSELKTELSEQSVKAEADATTNKKIAKRQVSKKQLNENMEKNFSKIDSAVIDDGTLKQGKTVKNAKKCAKKLTKKDLMETPMNEVDKDENKVNQGSDNKKDMPKKKANTKISNATVQGVLKDDKILDSGVESNKEDNKSQESVSQNLVETAAAKKTVTKKKPSPKKSILKQKATPNFKLKLVGKRTKIAKLDASKIKDLTKALKLSKQQNQAKNDIKSGIPDKNEEAKPKEQEQPKEKLVKKKKIMKNKETNNKAVAKSEDKHKINDPVDISEEKTFTVDETEKPAGKGIKKKVKQENSKNTSDNSEKAEIKKANKGNKLNQPPIKRLKHVAKKINLTPKSTKKCPQGLKIKKHVKNLKRVVKTKIGLGDSCNLTTIKLKLKSNKNANKKEKKPIEDTTHIKEENVDTDDASPVCVDVDKIKDIKKEENVQDEPEPKVQKPQMKKVKPEPSKRLKKLWNTPKGRRVASLNALAKVHCLYENEGRSAFELGLLKTTKKTEKQEPEEPQEKEKVVEKPPRTLRTCAMPSVGKHWDMHELSSTSASSCTSNSTVSSSSSVESDSDCETIKKPIKVNTASKTSSPNKDKDKVVVKVKRKRNRLDVTMDLKDMVVRKRMASLNATAILAASYENDRKFSRKGHLIGDVTTSSSCSSSSISSSSDGSLDDPIYKVAGGAIKTDRNPVKIEPTQNLEVLDSIKKEEEHEVSLIVNQDTDVTITGVYLNTTTRSTLHRRLHHHRTASSSSVSHLHRSRYHISSSSSCSSNGVLLETGTKDVSGSEGSVGGSYTPLGALSSMRPPHQHNVINTTTISTGPGSPILVRHTSCSSAFSAPPHGRTSNHSAETRTTNCSSSSPGYYQPAGPLITSSHHSTAANHFHHHHHHQSQQQHLLVQQSAGNMQPIEPSMQNNQPSLDQPVKKLSEDSQEVVYHRSTATLPAQYAQQVLPAHYYPPPPPGGYGDPQGALCYGPAQYGHAQAVAAAAYYHAARKVYAPPSPPPSGGSLNPPQQNPQNLQVVSQAANLQAVPVPSHDAFRRYVGPSYYQPYAGSGSPGPSLVEYPPPPSAASGLPPPPGRFYPPAYGAPTGPPPCYGHHQPPPSQQRALAYIDPPYPTPCPCPMQSCQSKNALTGPLIGSELTASDNLNSTLTTSTTQLTCLSSNCQNKLVDASTNLSISASQSSTVSVSTSNSSATQVDLTTSRDSDLSNTNKKILGVKGPVTNHSLCNSSGKNEGAVMMDNSVLDSITASQQRVMRFKSEAGADDLSNSVQRQPVVPPIVFLPLADPVPIRPQSSPVRDQNTLNNNLLMTNIKVQSDQEVVKPRKPRIGKSMVRNNMLLANNILITSQEHHQADITNLILTSSPASRHHLKHNIISDIDRKHNIIQNDITREDEKEGFEELIKHEIYDDVDLVATDLTIKKCDDIIKQGEDDIIINVCTDDDEKKLSDISVCKDGVKVCKNSMDDKSNPKQRKKCVPENETTDNGEKNAGNGKVNAKQRKRNLSEEKNDSKRKKEDKSNSALNVCSEVGDRTKAEHCTKSSKKSDSATTDLVKKVPNIESGDDSSTKKSANKTKLRRKLSTDNKCDVRTNTDKETEKEKINKKSSASDETKGKKCENNKKSNKISGNKKIIKSVPDKSNNKTKVKRLVKNKSEVLSKALPKRLKLLKSLNSDVTNSEPIPSKVKTQKEVPPKATANKTVKSTDIIDTMCNNNNEVPDSDKNKIKCKAIAKNRKGRPSLSKKQDVLVIPKRSLSNPRWSNGWSWEGEPFKGNVFLNSDELHVTRTCYPSMRHIEGDQVRPRDCVLLKSGQRKVDLPFVAKVAALWENPEDGEMMMSLLWYYRAEHTEQGNHYYQNHKDEVFASRHKDTNSVACIEDKCYVLTFNEYCRYRKHLKAMEEGIEPKNTLVPLNSNAKSPSKSGSEESKHRPTTNNHQSTSHTDMTTLLNTAPELILFCRKVYDFRQKRIMKNPS